MNYIGLNTYDTANGPGIRVSLFVSGCSLCCPGCFNQEAWDFKAGQLLTDSVIDTIIQELKKDYISGFSLLGGDPFEPENQWNCQNLCYLIKKAVPDKDIWAWSGRMYSQIKNSPALENVDVLVDGPYIEKLKGNFLYRGSSNQNINYLNKEIKYVKS